MPRKMTATPSRARPGTSVLVAVLLAGTLLGGLAVFGMDRVNHPTDHPMTIVVSQMDPDFNEHWPLLVEAVELSCEPPNTVVFTTVDGRRYGLNGPLAVFGNIDELVSKDPTTGGTMAGLLNIGLSLCR
jgi:hypothetical protein